MQQLFGIILYGLHRLFDGLIRHDFADHNSLSLSNKTSLFSKTLDITVISSSLFNNHSLNTIGAAYYDFLENSIYY